MEITTLLTYLLASIILFFLLNKIEKQKKEIFHFVIITAIYIIFVSGICTSMHITKNNDSIFIIILLELLIRIFYLNIIKEINILKDTNIIKKYFYNFIFIFLLNSILISKVKNIFLDLEQTKIFLWLLIMIYLSNITNDYMKQKNSKKNIPNKKKNKNETEKEYIVMQYAKLKNKYSQMIHTKYEELRIITYAIMIYENKKKPEIVRKLDYLIYKLNGKAKKFGVMQIYSKYYIDDENSISIAVRRLERIYYKMRKEPINDKQILKEYYKNDNTTREILKIIRVIKNFNEK